MFKNLITYRIGADCLLSLESVAEALAKETFAPCAPTQPLSVGWAPPRGIEHGALVEAVDGHWLLSLHRQQRLLPSSVVQERVEELMEHIEETTGRKPGKKARKELKEQATHELLPRAFTKDTATRIWIAVEQRMVLIDAGSTARADEAVTLLIQAVPGLSLQLLQTRESPAAVMAAWLMDGDTAEGFSIGRELELKGSDEQKPVVRYARHALDIDEVRAHLVSGKMPTRMSMDYKERVSFTLTEGFMLKNISFLDLAFEGRPEASGDEAFDADLALATGELSRLIPALIEGLGGEHDFAKEVAARPEAQAPEDEELYAKAVAVVAAEGKASISLVQARLRIGFNRAARLLERMEQEGVVGPEGPQGARPVLVGKAVAA